MSGSVTVAIVQDGPEYLDIRRSLDKAVSLVEQAAAQEAELVVFGETWLTGYPAWLDHCPDVALWDHEPTKLVFSRMRSNGISVGGPETNVLGELARRFGLTICIGVNEVYGGSLFNSLLVFDQDGTVANHHRKLMPTHTERLLYGLGDGYGLKTVETPYGRMGGLICWEHWMPLARQAMHDCRETIHVAMWPWVHDRHQLASRNYAFEGRCYVIAVGQIMRVRDIPAELRLPAELADDPDRLLLNGGSCIVAPDGSYVLEPRFGEPGLITHRITDLDMAHREKMTLDTAGHYSRPDVFDLRINRQRCQTDTAPGDPCS